MLDLLKNQYIDYLNSKKPHLTPFQGSALTLKTEVTSDGHFDIMDQQPTICQPTGKGSATYHNPEEKVITFIDYEHFMNQLPADLQKGIKRCDFIAYSEPAFFVLNELSQSSTPKTKLSDARQQLHQTALNLSKTPHIASFMDAFEAKKCVFSNKNKLIPTPDNMAEAFSKIKDYLPDPIVHHYQPITKLGFQFIETATVEV